MTKEELKPKKILIVDDNRDAADSLAKLFVMLGADARAVYSGSEAILFVEQFTPELFILDISMPQMSGFELLDALRKRGFEETPIVALTGHGLRDDIQNILEAGFDDHYTKPVGLSDLRKLLESV